MIRLGKNVFSSVLAGFAALSLAACGGAHHGNALPSTALAAGALAPDALVATTFTIKIPAPTTTSTSRRPSYISAATKSVRVNMTANSAGVPITSQFNVLTQVTNSTGNSPAAPCTGSGPWTCSVTLNVPPGSDSFTFTTYDDTTGTGTGSSHILSQQIQTLTIVKATANAFTITFDANADAISISGTQPCTSGSIQNVFGSGQGTSPVTFTVSFTDLAGKTITGAPTTTGAPTIVIKGNDNQYHSDNGTINGTGGNATFSINQNARSFTLTPSAVPLSNVAVDVKGVPANSTGSSDGLTFTAAADHQFTFSANTPPPAHNFLAIVEQNTAQTSGQINFFQTSLGGSGGPDSISAWSTAPTLASTNSINQSAPDVDNPEAIVFDSGGNLLIANGGQGGAVTSYAPSGDYGNFACVPAGAIANGAALSTTNMTNLRVPDAIAVSSDGSVSIANNPASAAKNVQDFTLSTNYVASSSFSNPGTYGVPLGRPLVNVPTLTAGTFAFTIFDGTNSKLVVLGPTGTTATVTNSTDTHLNNPFAMAWDPVNSQLVVGDNHTPDGKNQMYLNFYTVGAGPSTPVNVKSFYLQQDPDPVDDCPGSPQPAQCAGLAAQKIAVAPTTGYLAVAGLNGYNSTYGGVEIQLYDASHNPMANGVIAFDGAVDAASACSGSADPTTGYVYGENGTSVTDLQWLSSTKLLVLFKNPNKTSVQGIYIFDVSATAAQNGYWGPYSSADHACHSTAVPNGPKQTFFQNVTPLVPLAATFKP